jgi:hypothetical protein
MFGKVKKWLGIEGVKLELLLPEEVSARDRQITGKLRFMSMNPQTVTYIKVVLIEKYSRGRGNDKLIDEYELGNIELYEPFDVPAEEMVEIDFTLPYKLVKSDIEEWGDRNPLFGGLARMAKSMNAVHSNFRIEAEAKVKGTALNPFDKKELNIA